MKIRSLLMYSALRLAVFAVPLVLLLMLPFFQQDGMQWIAVVFAALIGLSLSIIFLNKPLGEFSTQLAGRKRERTAAELDSDSEDAVVDASSDASE